MCLFLAFMMLCIPACGKEKKLYKEAVAAIEETDLQLDGSNEMSEHIAVALENADYKEAKNIIVMIGDGMGFNILDATQVTYEEELCSGTLAMRYMPVQSTQTTYSATDQITDSGAGATALATGNKTRNYRIGVDATETEDFKNVLEVAAKKGKSTGIIATKSVTDATPADFTAHVADRDLHEEIAAQQMDKLMDGTLDLALGSGRAYYESEENAEKFSKLQKEGVTYTTAWDATVESKLPVVGLYGEELYLDTTDEAVPTIAEMTDYALNMLSEDEDGFFLMVEGSQIDSWGEKNVIDRQMKEAYDFDCAVAVAMRYVALHPDTVLIITADHETGDLELPENLTPDSILKEHAYHTEKHSYKTVPVFAAGYRTEELSGVHENTDIGIFVASLLGEEEFGHTSTTHTLLDTNEKEDVKVLLDANPSAAEGKDTVIATFDETHTEFVVPIDKCTELQETVEYLRVFHMTVTNTSNVRLPLPTMNFEHMRKAYSVKPQDDYIEPGETVELSYVFPTECWALKQLENISQLIFSVEGANATLEFSNMRVTERSGGK